MQDSLFDMDGLNQNLYDKFIKDLQGVCDYLVHELNYPSHFLVVNKSEGKTVTSFSVAVNEPVSPFGTVDESKASSAAGFLYMKDSATKKDAGKIQIHVPVNVFEAEEAPLSAESVRRDPKGAASYYEVKVQLSDESLIPYLGRIVKRMLSGYVSSQPRFGCCHLYKECSDAQHCVHDNPLFVLACQYKRNLESGKIFYGRNRNI